MFAPVGEFFQGVWDTIVSLFGSIGTAVGDAISGAVRGAINAVLSGAAGIINAIPGVSIEQLPALEVPQLAEGGIVTAPTLLEAGEAGDEAIIPLPELWGNIQSLLTDALELGNGAEVPSLSGLLDGPEWEAPPADNSETPPVVIYYQPHLHFEGGTPSREDIVEEGRISQEEFNRMAAKWQKDAARLSLRE